MRSAMSMRGWLSSAVLISCTAWLLPQLHAAGGDPVPISVALILREAEQFEANGLWEKALERYGLITGKERSTTEFKDRYLLCLRRVQQVRRHQDPTYRQHVLSLSLHDSLKVYGEVLSKLQANYVERNKAALSELFKQGLEELRQALSDDAFRRDHLPNAPLEEVRRFQEQLESTWDHRSVRQIQDAQNQVRDVAMNAQTALGLKAALVILEFAAGACTGLDEYTSYLTPGQWDELDAAWKGTFVGVGIDVAADGPKLVVSQVWPGTSAGTNGLRVGDQILRIAGKTTLNMTVEMAADLLKGAPETNLELEVFSTLEMRPKLLKLKRQILHMPSVSEPRFLDERREIGFLQLTTFQETTIQELDEAILQLRAAGMKVLILDLRGNMGGLFDVAVQVAERFLSKGVIVVTQGQREYNATYRAHGMSSLDLPLVVLVDGETASSAEMLAGALKDNHNRAKLVGQTTFGKGSIQKACKLEAMPAGIRVTVAKFYSPHGRAYSDNGVEPHVVATRPTMAVDIEQDPQVQAAIDIARPLTMGR